MGRLDSVHNLENRSATTPRCSVSRWVGFTRRGRV